MNNVVRHIHILAIFQVNKKNQKHISLVKQFSQILEIVKSSSFMPMLCTSKTDCLTYHTLQEKCLLVLDDHLVPSQVAQTL